MLSIGSGPCIRLRWSDHAVMTVSPDSSTHVIEAYTVGVIVALLSNINTIKLNAIFKFNMEKLDNIFAISYTNMRNLRYNFTEVGVPPV